MPRITTRRLMALVALAAILAGLWDWNRRWSERAAHRRIEAARHAMLAGCWTNLATLLPEEWDDSEGTWSTQDGGKVHLAVAWDWHLVPGQGPLDVLREWDGVRADCRARAAHHEQMRTAWEDSARRFWAGEPAEPPRPPIRSRRFRIAAE